MSKGKFIKALVTILCFTGLYTWAEIEFNYFNFSLQDGKNQFLLTGKKKLRQYQAKGFIDIFNGKSKRYDKCMVNQAKNYGNYSKLVLDNSAYTLTCTFTPRNNIILASMELVNKSDRELWLEPAIHIMMKRSEQDFFYNGLELIPFTGKELSRFGIKGIPAKRIGGVVMPFPVSALIGTEATILNGIVNFEPVSYHGTRLISESGNHIEIISSHRHAIGAGRRVKTRLALGMIPTRYGKEQGVIQAMYDAFPELWQPAVGQDNLYIWGAHAQYRTSRGKSGYEAERRYHSSIDWSMSPYKRAGDIYGRKAAWNYRPLLKPFCIDFGAVMHGFVFDYAKISQEEFQKRRHAIYRKYAQDFGWAFYAACCGTWCEYSLAKEKYPDAINTDTEKVPLTQNRGWTKAYDKEIRVFPMGTSFAKAFREDLKNIYDELKVPGFALDGAAGGAFYRGPATKNPELPGRAWDQKGVFIDQSIACNNIIKYIHNDLNPGAKPKDKPFAWANGSGVRSDFTMIETNLFDVLFDSWMPLIRYHIGAVPCCIHRSRFIPDRTIPNWRNMSRKEFLEELNKLAVYSNFNCFRYCMTSAHATNNGNPTEVYCIPELLEVRRLGWQAQIPVQSFNNGQILYQARYGRGADTVFFFGNPYAKPMKLLVKIGNEVLGKQQYVFVRKMRDHAETINNLQVGETSIREELSPRIPYLFEAVCGFDKLPEDGLRARVKSRKDINKITFTVYCLENLPFHTVITPRRIRNFTFVEVLCNGKKVKLSDVNVPSNAVLEFSYKSKLFHNPAMELLSFPFLNKKNQPGFIVQIPAVPNEAELKQAGRIQEYFDFCAQNKITVPGKILVDKRDSVSEKPCIRISVGRRNCAPMGVSRIGKSIIVNAADQYQATVLVRALSYVMDRKFEYLIPFSPTDGLGRNTLEKFDLLGKTLPLRRCFETAKLEKGEKKWIN